MNTTEYKGFTIHEINGRFCAQDKGDAKFNPKGYATLNTAKGAITKHVNASVIDKALEKATTLPVSANPELDIEGMKSVANATPKAATKDDKVRASIPVVLSVRKSRNQREGRYAGKVDGVPARYRDGVNNRYCHSFTNDYYWASRKALKALRITAKNQRTN